MLVKLLGWCPHKITTGMGVLSASLHAMVVSSAIYKNLVFTASPSCLYCWVLAQRCNKYISRYCRRHVSRCHLVCFQQYIHIVCRQQITSVDAPHGRGGFHALSTRQHHHNHHQNHHYHTCFFPSPYPPLSSSLPLITMHTTPPPRHKTHAGAWCWVSSLAEKKCCVRVPDLTETNYMWV